MKGAWAIEEGSTPAKRWTIVVLPLTTTLLTCDGSTPSSAQTAAASRSRSARTSPASTARPPGSSIVKWMRVITSWP